MLSVVFVDGDVSSGGDGSSWQTAYRDLQSALESAEVLNSDMVADNDVDQIWIAEGTYTPSAELEAGNPRSAAFSLLDNVSLYGGFRGDEVSLADRDPDPLAHETILSGDIGTPGDDSDNAHSVVYCGSRIPVTLDGLTISGGNANGQCEGAHPENFYGGGIYNYLGLLTVTNSKLAGNRTEGEYGYGGGIYNYFGMVDVVDSTVEGNSSGSGGGIYNSGWLTLEGTTVSGNSAAGGLMRQGGGVFSYGSLVVNDSTFFGNTAGFGGGIAADTGSVSVTNTTFLENIAVDDGFAGGGIATQPTTSLSVTNSTFVANSGAGIANRGTTTVTNSTFREHMARAINNFEDLTVIHCTFVGNRSGAVYSYGNLDVIGSVFVGNTSNFGSAVWVRDNLRVTSSTFVGNDGPVFWDHMGTVEVTNSVFWNNTSGLEENFGRLSTASLLIGADPHFVRDPSDGGDGWGDDPATENIDESANDDYGDLRLTSQSPAINLGNNDYVPQDLQDLDGDGITDELVPIDFDGNPRMYDGVVDCGAFEFQGEIAPGRETPSLTVTTAEDIVDFYDDRVSLREAIYYAGTNGLGAEIVFDLALNGATIALNGSRLHLDKTVTVNASALDSLTVDGDGRDGVFKVTPLEASEAALVGLTITGGDTGYGAGVHNYLGTIAIADCYVQGNHASLRGGGIYNDSGAVTITNSVISGNIAAGDSGGGVFTIHGSLAVTNTTVAGNQADYDGGGIYLYNFSDTTATIQNTIVARNAAHRDPNLYIGERVDLSVSHSLIADYPWDDPRFVRNPHPGSDGQWGTEDDDYGDLRLPADSPAIDAGANALALDVEGNWLTNDLAGGGRVLGGIVDMGAYEFVPEVLGDVDGDGYVGARDLDRVRLNWGRTVQPGSLFDGDVSGDGKVDSADLELIRLHWQENVSRVAADAFFDGLAS